MTTLDTALITDAVSGDIAAQAFEGLYTLNKETKLNQLLLNLFQRKVMVAKHLRLI